MRTGKTACHSSTIVKTFVLANAGQRCTQLAWAGCGDHEQLHWPLRTPRVDGVGLAHPRRTVERETVPAGAV